MNLPVMIGGERPPAPDCPSCGRPMVYHSNLHRYQCHPCAIAEREKAEAEETVPIPWWFWLILIGVLALLIAMFVFSPVPYHNGSGNLTQSAGTVDVVTSHWMGLAYVVVLVVAVIVVNILTKGKERCPSCGKVLKVTPTGDYYCMRCRKMYDPEDIEVEVVE